MKQVLIYCQHILGMGHLARMLKLAQLLAPHAAVTLVSGGRPTPLFVPANITFYQLTPLHSDASYQVLMPPPSLTLEEAWLQRETQLGQIAQHPWDACITELFPFGRMGFAREISGFLTQLVRQSPRIKILSSLRDLLTDPLTSTGEEMLRTHYHGILVHSAPELNPLSSFGQAHGTFQGVPYHCTGLLPPVHPRASAKEDFAVLSLGGGAVGEELLRSTLATQPSHKVRIFPGPYYAGPRHGEQHSNLVFETESSHFASILSAAQLSLSLAGHNTLSEAALGGTFTLCYPLQGNAEQTRRADIFADLGLARVLTDADLAPKPLEKLIHKYYSSPVPLQALPMANGVDLFRVLEGFS